MIYHYYCNSWDQLEPTGEEYLFDIEHRKVDDIDEWEWEMLAQACAEDYLHNHDGWEHKSWCGGGDPMEFWLYDENKVMIGKFDVYLEYEPTFSATRVNG